MSSNNFPNLELPIKAGAAIAAHRALKYGAADNTMIQCAAASNVGLAVSRVAMATDDVCDAHFGGVVPIEYGDTVTRGQRLTYDSVGRAIPAAAGDAIIGIAAESGVLGTIGSVDIAPGHAPPTPGVVTSVTKTVGFADLTDADGTQTFAFAAALPANAFIIGSEIRVTEGFTDGVAGVFTADLGVNGADIDSIHDGVAIGAIANLSNAPGVRPTGRYGAVTPAITILADVNVTTATEGALVAEITYVVPA